MNGWMLMPSFNLSTVPADDFRVDYLEQARECLRANNKLVEKHPNDWHTFPEFWANHLGAVANSNIAAAPNDVALGLHLRIEKSAKRKADFKEMLDKKLGKP